MDKILKTEIKLVNHLVNRLVLIWMVLSTVGIIIIASRAHDLVGFQLREYIYFTLYFLVIIVYIYRARIKTKTKGVIFMGFLFIMAYVGIYNFGFMAPSALFIPMISVLLALFYNARVVVLFTLLMLLMVTIVGFSFVSGFLYLSIDANDMILSADHWRLYLLGLTFFALFVSTAILKYKKTMLNLIEQITAHKMAMEKLANHDQLTGLPISQMAQLHFEQAIARSGEDAQIALMFLDLDQFKQVNDTYGHDAGDLCLQHVAKQATKVLNGGKIYRLGGDEFLILFENFNSNDEVMSAAYEVVKAIAEPLVFLNNRIVINTSIGVAIYKQQGEKFNDLRRAADTAMYKAKQSHDANICLVSAHSA